MIEELLNKEIISKIPINKDLCEVRLRLDNNLIYSLNGKYFKTDYIVKNEDISFVIKKATNNSFYSHEDNIKNGYISYKNLRIGLAGEGVINNDSLMSLKNITSLCIRIGKVYKNNDLNLNKIIENFDNTLILSKPGYGKTTLLRDIIIRLSNKLLNILVIDEKGEISMNNTISLGVASDVIINIPKKDAYKQFIRVLRPDVIATDEVFGEAEVISIKDSIRCGVKVIATLHANSLSTINQPLYEELLSVMRYVVVLENIGLIKEIYDKTK